MDLHFRMIARTTLLYMYMFAIILESNIAYIVDNNMEYEYIKRINMTIITLT